MCLSCTTTVELCLACSAATRTSNIYRAEQWSMLKIMLLSYMHPQWHIS